MKLKNINISLGPCVHEAPNSQLQGKDLLLHLFNCNHKPRVLIDPGALLVSLSNREVAEIWLDHSDPSIVGAVSLASLLGLLVLFYCNRYYFENNKITAIDRSKQVMDFLLSPFCKKLAQSLCIMLKLWLCLFFII